MRHPLFEPVQPGRIFIKICGVCNLDDARACSSLGVNAIGMLLRAVDAAPKSNSDRLSVSEAAALVAALPEGLRSILLIHSTQMNDISAVCEDIAPSALQIQGAISSADLRSLKVRWPTVGFIKSFAVGETTTVESLMTDIRSYLDCGAIDAVLLDSARGGSGQVHNWPLSEEVIERLPTTPVLLAGGLNATNVVAALRQVRPWGVDVMSSVTSQFRDKKDPEKLRVFVEAVRAAEAAHV